MLFIAAQLSELGQGSSGVCSFRVKGKGINKDKQ